MHGYVTPIMMCETITPFVFFVQIAILLLAVVGAWVLIGSIFRTLRRRLRRGD
jgi:hypothetical protein